MPSYHYGVSNGVFYNNVDSEGVPWEGLIGFDDKVSESLHEPVYYEGEKIGYISNPKEFSGTITCYTYPKELEPFIGYVAPFSSLTHRGLSNYVKLDETTPQTGCCIKFDTETDNGKRTHYLINLALEPQQVSYSTVTNAMSPSTMAFDLSGSRWPINGIKQPVHFWFDTSDVQTPDLLTITRAIRYTIARLREYGILEIDASKLDLEKTSPREILTAINEIERLSKIPFSDTSRDKYEMDTKHRPVLALSPRTIYNEPAYEGSYIEYRIGVEPNPIFNPYNTVNPLLLLVYILDYEGKPIGTGHPSAQAVSKKVLMPFTTADGGSFYSYLGRTDYKRIRFYVPEGTMVIGHNLFSTSDGYANTLFFNYTIDRFPPDNLSVSNTYKFVPNTGYTTKTSYSRKTGQPSLTLDSESEWTEARYKDVDFSVNGTPESIISLNAAPTTSAANQTDLYCSIQLSNSSTEEVNSIYQAVLRNYTNATLSNKLITIPISTNNVGIDRCFRIVFKNPLGTKAYDMRVLFSKNRMIGYEGEAYYKYAYVINGFPSIYNKDNI